MNLSENDMTIASYELNAGRYAAATRTSIDGPLQRWLATAVQNLATDAPIFEIGSGTGRDALYLQSLGYSIECSDATYAFLEQLSARGLSNRYFNVLTDQFNKKYTLILANAVLLHINHQQLSDVLIKVYAALEKNGRFALTLKEGQGEAWTDAKVGQPRYFCYWDEDLIRTYLTNAGFKTIRIFKSGPYESRWLNIIAQTQ